MSNVLLSDWFKDTKTDAAGSKDWVFLNYTFKRFEGLTQRGVKLPLKWTVLHNKYFPSIILYNHAVVNLKIIYIVSCQSVSSLSCLQNSELAREVTDENQGCGRGGQLNPLLFTYHTCSCTSITVPAGIAEGREDSSQSIAKSGMNCIASYFKEGVAVII